MMTNLWVKQNHNKQGEAALKVLKTELIFKHKRGCKTAQGEGYVSTHQRKGCTPHEQMLQLRLVTHINREQMAARVAAEREGGGRARDIKQT